MPITTKGKGKASAAPRGKSLKDKVDKGRLSQGGAGDAGHEDDEAINALFQEDQKDETAVHRELRRASIIMGQKMFKIGPDYIDEDYVECTPVPLYEQNIPMFDYGSYLDKQPDDIIKIQPIRPQTFSALFAFYKERGPALNWDPRLTDVEEDCFFQEIIHYPTFAFNLPPEKLDPKKRLVKIFEPNGDFSVDARLFIDLEETSDIVLVDIKGSFIPENDESYAETVERNEKYEELVTKHAESPEAYTNNCSQTFENYKLNKYTDYKIAGCNDKSTDCHTHYIEDDYKRVAEEDLKRTIRENDELLAKQLAEKARQDIPESGWKSSDEEEEDDDSDEEEDLLNVTGKVDVTRYLEDDVEDDVKLQRIQEEASEDDIPMSSEDDDEFEIRMQLEAVYERKRLNAKHHGLRLYPDISGSILALEQMLCEDAMIESGQVQPSLPIEPSVSLTPAVDEDQEEEEE